jgi:hypothetical protein
VPAGSSAGWTSTGGGPLSESLDARLHGALLSPRAGRECTNGATSRILALSSPYVVVLFASFFRY